MLFFDPGFLIQTNNHSIFYIQISSDDPINVRGHKKSIREKSGFESGYLNTKESKAQIILKELEQLADEEVEIGLDFRVVPSVETQNHLGIFIRRTSQMKDTISNNDNDFIGMIEWFATRYGIIPSIDDKSEENFPNTLLKRSIFFPNSNLITLPKARGDYYLSRKGDMVEDHKNIGQKYVRLLIGSASQLKNNWLQIMAAAQHLNNLNIRYDLLKYNSNWGMANLLYASDLGDLINTKIKTESKWNSLGLYAKPLDMKYLKNDGIFKFRTVDAAKAEVDKLNLKRLN
jgi:hypothetical protein